MLEPEIADLRPNDFEAKQAQSAIRELRSIEVQCTDAVKSIRRELTCGEGFRITDASKGALVRKKLELVELAFLLTNKSGFVRALDFMRATVGQVELHDGRSSAVREVCEMVDGMRRYQTQAREALTALDNALVELPLSWWDSTARQLMEISASRLRAAAEVLHAADERTTALLNKTVALRSHLSSVPQGS